MGTKQLIFTTTGHCVKTYWELCEKSLLRELNIIVQLLLFDGTSNYDRTMHQTFGCKMFHMQSSAEAVVGYGIQNRYNS